MRAAFGKERPRAQGQRYPVAGSARRDWQGAGLPTSLSAAFAVSGGGRRFLLRGNRRGSRESAGGRREPQRAAEGAGRGTGSRGHGEWGARRRRGLSGGAGDALWRARWGAREKRAVAPGVLRRGNVAFKRAVPTFHIPLLKIRRLKRLAIRRDRQPFCRVPFLKPPLQSRRPSPRGKSRGAGKARAARRSPLSGRPPFCGDRPSPRRFLFHRPPSRHNPPRRPRGGWDGAARAKPPSRGKTAFLRTRAWDAALFHWLEEPAAKPVKVPSKKALGSSNKRRKPLDNRPRGERKLSPDERPPVYGL